jgi:hypothetical protein
MPSPVISAKNRGTAIWEPSLNLAKVTKIKGNYFTTLGFNKKQDYFIYPEEVLFLLKKGALNFYNSDELVDFDNALIWFLSDEILEFKDYQV